MEDWYTVNLSDLHEVGFPARVTKLRLVQLLNIKYPGQPWEKLFTLRGRFSQQKRLEKMVAELFDVSLPISFVYSFHFFLLIVSFISS